MRELVEGGAVLLIALLAVSIPFAAEGHFGILGTGFNVDMSQHLFVADGIAHPHTATPLLIRQGYPVGPHSLAATGAELTGGDLVSAFTGVTIAVPVLLALTALTATRELGPRRSLLAAPLAALPYLAASYLAQGSFKELFEAAFLVGFALWLRELGRHRGSSVAPGPGFAVPGALLFAGALYSYSGPGVAWLGGTLGVWALIAFVRSPGVAVGATARRAPRGRCRSSFCWSSSLRLRPGGSSTSAPTPATSRPRRRLPRGRPRRTPPSTPPPAAPMPGTATATAAPASTTGSATSSATSRRWRSSASGRAATSGSKPATVRSRHPSSTSAPCSALSRSASGCAGRWRRKRRRCSRRSPPRPRSGSARCSSRRRTRRRRRCRWSRRS